MEIGSINLESDILIIAELSANHGGDISIALETIRAAKRAGANAIKLQTYTADTITIDVKSDLFKIGQGTKWDGRFLFDLYKEASLPWEWHKELFDEAKKEGLICFSSPFDPTAVDFLEDLEVPAYKIASFEITDVGLIEYVASKGKPVIISTGIASYSDIDLAVKTCRKAGNNQIILLQCTSSYPAKIEDANLIMIKDMKDKFEVLTGLSDHSMGITVPVTATALGARVIEKHFILDKSIGGPDAHFSLDEKEFKEMVDAVRNTELAIGSVSYDLSEKKINSRKFSRSLFVVSDIKSGDTFTDKNIRSIRPGDGLHPKYLSSFIGKKASKDIKKGTPLSGDMIAGD